jgi:hypothetical protein
VVVNDLDVPRFTVSPNEANPPLIVNPNAVLTLAIPVQRFQAIARRHAEIVELLCRVDRQELCARPPLDLGGQVAHGIPGEDRSSAFVGKALDHARPYRKTVRGVNLLVPLTYIATPE